MRFTPALLGLVSLAFAATEGVKQPVTQADMLRIRRVTQVAVAPDGAFAIYGVQSMFSEPAPANKEEINYGYRTHLWFIDLNDSSAKPVQLTFGDRNDSAFALSPDGRTLAFVRDDITNKEKPKPQVWMMPVRGPGESQLVTKLEEGAANPVWRPDGKAILVISSVPLSKISGKPHFDLERPKRDWLDYDRPDPAKSDDKKPEKIDARPDGDRRAIRNWLEKNAAKDNPTDINRMNFEGEMGLEPEMRIPELFVVDLANSNKATQITKDFYNHGDPQYSPDGKQIVYVSSPPGPAHPDRLERHSAIWIVNADGSSPRVLLHKDAYSFFSPRYSADGKTLIVAGVESDEPGYKQSKVARLDTATGDIKWLAPNWDSSVGSLHIASDSSILFVANWQGGAPLVRIDGNGTDFKPLNDAATGVSAYDEAAGRIVLALISAANPNELYLRDKNGSLRQLTDLNQTWFGNKILSLPTEHWITRPDGTRVQYWVMNPTNAQPGKKYPFVLDMHGGPAAMWGPGEFSMWHEFQIFCSWGYGVVYANPRGSSGYGYSFQRANYKNWGDAPSADVLGALDDALKSNPLIDNDRLFITGGSYAGYLTAWIVGHDNRFKAAAALRGVYDLATFYGEGNAYRLVENEFGGFPWEATSKKLLEHESPFTYVDKIQTPLLIIHGSNDLRTGYVQSQMMFRALKQLNRPVEYIRYPNIGHELTRSGPPLQRMDHMLRIIEFFERYSNNDREAPQDK